MKNPVDRLFNKAKFATITLDNGQKFIAKVFLTHRSFGYQINPITEKEEYTFGGILRFDDIKQMKEPK